MHPIFEKIIQNHERNYPKYLDQPDPVVIDVLQPKDSLTAQQQEVLRVFNKWDWGCQRKDIRELVAALSGIPIALLKSGQSSQSGGIEVSLPDNIRGVFVVLLSKQSPNGWSSIRTPVNSTLYIHDRRALRVDGQITGDLYSIRRRAKKEDNQKTIQFWQDNIRLATTEEIQAFCKNLQTILDILPTKHTYITRVQNEWFPDVDKE